LQADAKAKRSGIAPAQIVARPNRPGPAAIMRVPTVALRPTRRPNERGANSCWITSSGSDTMFPTDNPTMVSGRQAAAAGLAAPDASASASRGGRTRRPQELDEARARRFRFLRRKGWRATLGEWRANGKTQPHFEGLRSGAGGERPVVGSGATGENDPKRTLGVSASGRPASRHRPRTDYGAGGRVTARASPGFGID
jgi:hypothetical protein